MRAAATSGAALLIAFVFLGWGGQRDEADRTSSHATKGNPANPTLFGVRQQCNEIAAFFPVDRALAGRWVPPAFELAVDEQGQAGAALIVMDCPNSSWVTNAHTPMQLPKPLRLGGNIWNWHVEPAETGTRTEVAASRATLFTPNNIVNNSSRGDLAWTTYPPFTLNCPPLLP